jgi:hypothetical protein
MAIELPKLVAENIGRFTGRAWLLPVLLDWYEKSDERIFLLIGGPGTGKSMISAWLAGFGPQPHDPAAQSQLKQLREAVKAVDFCQAASRNITPQALAENTANQLTANVPGFGAALAATLAERVQIIGTASSGTAEAGASLTGVAIGHIDLGTLGDEMSFDRAFTLPLKKLYSGSYKTPMLLLVDALDEAVTYSGITIADLLSRLADLPPQVRILATTRDDPRVLKFYRHIEPFDLTRRTLPSINDVEEYANTRLSTIADLSETQRSDFAKRVAQQAKGIFLYAAIVLDELLPRLPTVPDLDTYPLLDGLSGLYHDFLTRELGKSDKQWFDTYEPLLGLIAVAQGEGLKANQLAAISHHDVREALRACKQYLSGDLPEGPFRLFHKSFTDFLLEDKDNIDYHIDALTMHGQIADYYWQKYNGNWKECDAYGLHCLVAHLYQLRTDTGQREHLHALVQTRTFIDQRLRGSANPIPVLDDLRLALELALEEDSLAQAWRHIRCYYETARSELSVGKLDQDIRQADYSDALDRTQLYRAHPNPQAWARLWIAWWVASAGKTDMAKKVIWLALRDLPAFEDLTQLSKIQGSAVDELRDQLAWTAGRLLTRIAREVASTPEEQRHWLKQTLDQAPEANASWLLKYWSESPTEWAEQLPEPDKPCEKILEEVEREMDNLDSSAFRQLSLKYRDRLAGVIAHCTADSAHWQKLVDRAIRVISLDDYPSYREMALAWLAAGVLSHPLPEEARAAMGKILAAALETREPELPEDALTMALVFRNPAFSSMMETTMHADDLEQQLINLAKIREAKSTINDVRSAGRRDPWAWTVRRGSAIAAALYRSKHYKRLSDVSAILEFRTHHEPTQSFAGYRCLAYVSAAFRWLEPDLVENDKLRKVQQAKHKINEASIAAGNMVDKVLARERKHLVSDAETWIGGPWPDPADEADVTASLHEAERMPALIRSYYLQFLSAIWANDTARLKRLLPYALGDLTTTDAVFGRLVGALAVVGTLQASGLADLMVALGEPIESVSKAV